MGSPFFLAYMPDYHYHCLALSNMILKRKKITREQCLELNMMAETICR